jgi:hypothetical protein
MANRSRKAYLSILGLAAVAFVVDRMMFGGPAAAAASTSDELIPDNHPLHTSDRGTTGGVVLVRRDTAASRLSTLANDEVPGRDLGSVPQWLTFEQKPVAAASAPGEEPVRAWEKKHEVSGFTRGAQVGISIDGKFVRVGDQVDGMTLKEVDVEGGVAVFENHSGARATLDLPRRREQGSENPATRK